MQQTLQAQDNGKSNKNMLRIFLRETPRETETGEVLNYKNSIKMKIIKEIEKSRFTEERMNNIRGGEGNTCTSPTNPYLSCGDKYRHPECRVLISCESEYYLCVGPQASQKEACRPGFWTQCSQEIWLS